MDDVKIVGTLDVTQLVFYAFVLFFIALIFYLRREDRREGYPLEDEATGRVETPGGPLSTASPKTFVLPHGQGSVTPDRNRREPVDIAAKRAFGSNGAAFVPTGNPFADRLGPASWAERMHTPDLTAAGAPRIVPLSSTDHVTVAGRDADPVGMSVIGADGKEAGKVADVWVDMSEHHIRYLEVATTGGNVLAPMAMAKVHGRKGVIVIDAIRADQFADVPKPATAGQITLNEEERVVAYFGGGYLYADPRRQEPVL
ncbi:photosynthetic reaction center subunit H [Qipengyuania qiaonensis]|uniref:Photosynthetic reaction center subunit H n=1 Tax=Qipengyuania qiaonensis TaxID=2867240 RepID=A0ABS7JEU3_9SPHN|nr:photosynthetic reaction center subunit H [Qipengyuania qiaonensis]MBX7483537.1 photosynthetic reaction center subunit H [Qipengyuania qiaonensis]